MNTKAKKVKKKKNNKKKKGKRSIKHRGFPLILFQLWTDVELTLYN